MGTGIERLKSLVISRALKRGYYADGGGLYLQVSAIGNKSWVFRYRVRSPDPTKRRLREMGLGSFNAVTLSEARVVARACRKQLYDGVDPIDSRRQARAIEVLTFEQCAESYLSAYSVAWKNKKHSKQWAATLAQYAYPVFGSKPVQEVTVGLVMQVLEPIWGTKTETARRLRGRIERILNWATTMGHRHGENPARWTGLIDRLVPAHRKIVRVKHHAALPFSDIPDFMMKLRAQDGIGAIALEFAILTAARTSEVIGATWAEISLEQRTWTIPAGRMKAGHEHQVPLAMSAVELLRRMEHLRTGDVVFPGQSKSGYLSNMALLAVLKRMKRSDVTAHGFRSSFRDWVSECTDYPREVAEMALAHSIGNAVEAAYRRGDLFGKRRALMALWAKYCDAAQIDNVTPVELARTSLPALRN